MVVNKTFEFLYLISPSISSLHEAVKYDIYTGISGKTQGDINDNIPSKNIPINDKLCILFNHEIN